MTNPSGRARPRLLVVGAALFTAAFIPFLAFVRLLSDPTIAFLLLSALASSPATAQTGTTGTVQGHVFNPATKEYVRDAEVRLEGTSQVTYTSNDGFFQFLNVPAGQAKISVVFTGYNTATESVNVTAGQPAVSEISLTSTAAAPAAVAKDSGIVKLEAFSVS